MVFDVFGRPGHGHPLGTGSGTPSTAEPMGSAGLARDIMIPAELSEAEIERYLADLCHEWANLRPSEVRRVG